MSDEVSDFLRSVELLKERREEEDEARSRELEEKILQEKKERQARRAERARSISPQKSSPANTPPPAAHRTPIVPSASDGTSLPSPGLDSLGSPRQRRPDASLEVIEGANDSSTSPTKENDSPIASDIKRTSVTVPSPSIGMPSARSPLAWQRRPTSQASDRPKSRPLSMVAAENAARNSPVAADTAAPTPEQTVSRDQIAQALAGKDPSWFRQTADPGRGSAAFRKNQVEDQDTVDMPSIRTRLPGMSRESAGESSGPSPAFRPVTPTTRPSALESPLPLAGAQRLDPPPSDVAEDTDAAPTSRQSITSPPGRTSPTRPVSPTKGMGGFVQSAMMKRSDSVKRWSVNSPAGLQRADSVRPGMERGPTPKSGSRPKNMLREGSETPVPAPTSSEDNEAGSMADAAPTESAAPTLREATGAEEKTTPPSSPSKTMDPRRWSPTKSSSWLEAALNKPESPKAKAQPPAPAQPAWMVELNKAKAQKVSADLARSGPLPKKPEVKTGGLMRSTPMGASLKPSAMSGFPAVPPVATAGTPAVAELRGSLRKASPTAESSSESQAAPAPAPAPAPSKSKPETPPKKDFRANLKPRAPPHDAKAVDPADELKNVVGSLRRTKTQNYVAPDELKDNILKGKAALNVTGGPKKTDRKDEFKEAILKKKEDFKKAQEEGRSVTRETSSAGDKPIPEGIAKKLELQRTGTLSKQTASASGVPLPSSPIPALNRSSHASRSPTHDGSGSELGSGAGSEASSQVSKAATDGPIRAQGRVGGLAGRFNPALAGLIARGPPPASGLPKASGGASPSEAVSPETGEPAGPGPQLTHLTKNRARGPKRKAPTSVTKPVEQHLGGSVTAPKPEQKAAAPKLEKPAISPKPERIALTNPPDTALPADARRSVMQDRSRPAGGLISLVDSSKGASSEGTKPVGQPITLAGSTPVKTRPRSPTKVHEQVAALAALSQQSPKPTDPSDEASQPSSPKKLDLKRMSRFLEEQSQATPKPEPVKSRPSSPVKDRFPSLASAPAEKQPNNNAAELKPALPIQNSGFPIAENGPIAAAATATTKLAAAKKPVDAEPSVAGKGSRTTPTPLAVSSPPLASPRVPSPIRSPGKTSSDVTSLITEFFGPERQRQKYTADAAEILMRRPATTAKIQTQRAQLFQLSAEGKKTPVRAHNERVLFEREMYVCPHTYMDGSGKKVNEVYFWAGDEVPASEVDDACLFAAREARAFGGKLVRLAQGKETSEFLQALGGIVIVRRGSSNKYDSLAPNMLCGRRYLGQVAFDEVDFSPLSLCSGFPYLITQQGKCYLWKGKGSDVEELGCARLVGMDLALMGELVEIDEGSEPNGFWDMFGGGGRPASADHWRLKPSYDRYCGRLFCANAAADKQQITEISPYNQTDLLPSNIYVLDAFFEMYIIVGARSRHQYAAFRNALDFAQEYAILAAGMEDRPFVPISTVVLEGIPRDLKSVFRKWRDAASPTVMHPPSSSSQQSSASPSSGPLKRGRSLRIVPLTQALQALAE